MRLLIIKEAIDMKKYFFIRTDGKYVKLCFNEILYAEGSRNYTKIFTETKQYLVLITMKRLEQFLPDNLFVRIHKSFIISLEKIVQFDKETVWLKDRSIDHATGAKMEYLKFLAMRPFSNKSPMSLEE